LIRAALNIFLSLLLGAIALALCAYYAPDWLEFLQIEAGYLKDWILSTMKAAGSTSSINVWVRFLVQDEQLVFMAFVIVTRVLLYFVLSFIASLISGDAFKVEQDYHDGHEVAAERQRLEAERRAFETRRKEFEAEKDVFEAPRRKFEAEKGAAKAAT